MKKFLSGVFLAALICAWPTTPAQTRTPARGSSAQRPAPAQPAAPSATAQPKPTPQPIAAASTAAEDCGCEGDAPPAVVAVVNGVRIGNQDVEERIKDQIGELRKSVVEARRRELELQINSRLLEAEARKRGQTTAKLLQEEVVAKVVEPTEADAQGFYDANKSRINGEFKDLKGEIINYLRDQRQREQAKKFADRLRAAAQVKMNVPHATPPIDAAGRARVFAVVNGAQITSAKIEDSLKPLIYSAQERTYQLRQNEVDLRINDALLEQEAQKRKITTKALLDAEIGAKMKPVTETEARAFYDQNKERINGEFAQVKDQIINYLQETQARDLQASFAGQLRQGAAIQVYLRAPEAPVLEIATDDQPAKGSPTAPVTIVEFTDFQCPSCARVQPALEKLTAEYSDRVRLVVRDFPLDQHEHARKAAEAAEAARAQGKYWEYAALLFTNQTALGVDKLKEYATRVGLDRQKFDATLDSGAMADKVQRDLLDGVNLGVNSTPTLYVNGRTVNDRSYEGLRAAIEKALAEKSKK